MILGRIIGWLLVKVFEKPLGRHLAARQARQHEERLEAIRAGEKLPG